MLVRHVMSTEVFSLTHETPVIEALRSLRERRIRRAPIVDADGTLVGLVTENDLQRVLPGTVAMVDTPHGRAACVRAVGTIATKNVSTADPGDHIEDLARLFLRARIGGAPVVQHGQLVGMITETDVFRAVLGAANLADSTRVTVQRPQAENVTPALAVVKRLGLELAGLTEYPGPGGREVLVIRVRGRRDGELGIALTQAGWVLLDRRLAQDEVTGERRATG